MTPQSPSTVPDLHRALLPLLSSFRALTGLELVYKAGGFQGLPELPLAHREHRHPYCMAVKERLKRHPSCLEDCVTRVVARLGKRPEPFLKTCHAGVVELVVPVARGQGLVGVLTVGPMKARRGAAPHPSLRPGWRTLPLVRGPQLAAVRPLLSLLAAFAAKEHELLTLQQHASAVKHPKLLAALEALETRCGEPLRARALAAECGLSASRFVHVFKEQTGLTFTAYALARRLERAKRLLEASGLPVSQVAAETGWARQSSFAAAFRMRTGLTPLAWRRREGRPAGA